MKKPTILKGPWAELQCKRATKGYVPTIPDAASFQISAALLGAL